MQLSGDVQIAAPRARVWRCLNDDDLLARCIPGCDEIEAISDTERTVRVAVKVGPVRAKFAGQLRMEQVRPEVGCVMHFEGSGGAAGLARGSSSVELADAPGGTRLSYTAEAVVAGKLGQVGGRMIDAAAKQMADQFFQAFQQQLAAEGAVVAAVTPAVDATPVRMKSAPTLAAAGASAGAERRAVLADRTRPPPQEPQPLRESVRLLWFLMGSLSTALAMWFGARLAG